MFAVTARSIFTPQLRMKFARTIVYFTPDHEWLNVEGDIATVGITNHAQDTLGEVVYVSLPSADETFNKGDTFASVESVKAVSDVYSPVSGTIVKVNEALTEKPQLINESAEKDAWFVTIKMSNKSDLDNLMDAKAYKEFVDSQH